MVALSLSALVSKLNDTTRRALERAAGQCKSRTHYDIEIEHWLLALIEETNTDATAVLRQFGVDVSRVSRDLTRAVESFKTGNGRTPALAPNTVDLLRASWMVASVEYDAPETRSGHVLCALLSDETLNGVAIDASPEFEKIPLDALKRDLPRITAASIESNGQVVADSPDAPTATPVKPPGGGGGGRTPNLDQFTIDLTAQARAGKIDPVLGRDNEIRQVIDILCRRRQNNPILTGEAGVGKTAVVEGFALRVAAGDVPPALRGVSIRTLDLGLLQAGAGVKGEFENRLKSVIGEVKASPQPIILFIDEAHTLIGAGGAEGHGDAANLLKPALARGELRTIAATTWAEYKKYFEKDAALTRRFQVIKVEEPTEAVAVEMLRGLVATLERHHGVRILDEALRDAVKLSHRYIASRQLPDKAISVLDTACARVALGQAATPPAIEARKHRLEQLAVARGILEREQASGADHSMRLTEMSDTTATLEAELAGLEGRLERERKLVEEIRAVRSRLEGAAAPSGKGANGAPKAPAPKEAEQLRARLDGLRRELEASQGETPLLRVCVDAQVVAEVVADWTGIPLGRMVADEIDAVFNLEARLGERIIGQSHALEAIARRIRTSRAGLTDPRRPIGVFLMVGPSGVGKTETALRLAELLYGGELNLTVINMSEYKEEHKVSLLMGSPPGYVGYGEGGVLTEAVRRRPYSVVLLDEMEKAHPGVQDVFYQVFDKGTLTDGEGRVVDFKNTVIIMTSNAGTGLIMKLCADPATRPDAQGLAAALHEELLKTFKPAFLGRVTLLPYYPLGDEVMRGIVELQLQRIAKRVHEHHGAAMTWAPEVVAAVVARCTEVDSGARNVDHILTRSLLPGLSREILGRLGRGVPTASVRVSMDSAGDFAFELG